MGPRDRLRAAFRDKECTPVDGVSLNMRHRRTGLGGAPETGHLDKLYIGQSWTIWTIWTHLDNFGNLDNLDFWTYGKLLMSNSAHFLFGGPAPN